MTDSPRLDPADRGGAAVDPDVHAQVVAAAAAEGVSVSAWMTAAARRALRVQEGLAAVAEWEAEHGLSLARSRRRPAAGRRPSPTGRLRLASLNLNKRLRTTAARARLNAWLHERNVDVLAAQETWKTEDGIAVTVDGYHHIGGDAQLSAWVRERWTPMPITRPEAFLQRIELGWLGVFNTYLDAYAGATRVAQLRRLRELTLGERGRPMLLIGDFNLAPRAADGCFGEEPSSFNGESERATLRDLVTSARLVDTTAADIPEFTFVRVVNGQVSRFRCDLALLSDHLQGETMIIYDHAPRASEQRFTDHSAILAHLPITLAAQAQQALFDLDDGIEVDNSTGAKTEYQPHKTAMSRASRSPAADAVVSMLVPRLQIVRVLDHGCGRGADVAHYRACGLEADGWDPHPGFGFCAQPSRTYDLVTSVFVLNVLPNPWQRIQALQHAASFVRPGGWLLVVTRSPADIGLRAKTGGWNVHHDGYWSSEAKETFQKGISAEEIIGLARHAGMDPAADQDLLLLLRAACVVLLVKPTSTGYRATSATAEAVTVVRTRCLTTQTG
jgi:endonuclease/exonuclease/phosphatase family metal-dependent hydrolase